jgi:AcrR family transcriptional regulator
MNQRPVPAPEQPTAGKSPWAETKEKILDAAERLFAERGIEATSIRDIIGVAEVNLGAVNYHFGTKQELAAAVFGRRLEPLNQRRLALLVEAEQNAGGRPPKLETLIEAMVRPVVEGSFAAGKRNLAFMRLMGRSHGAPGGEIERLIRAQFGEVMSRFASALQRALPGIPREELVWRIRFMFGAVHHALLACGREDSASIHPRQKLDAEGLVRRLVAFTAAGIKTPFPGNR